MKLVKKIVKADFNERPLRSAIAQLYNLKAYVNESQSSVANAAPEEKRKANELVDSALKACEELKKSLLLMKKSIG